MMLLDAFLEERRRPSMEAKAKREADDDRMRQARYRRERIAGDAWNAAAVVVPIVLVVLAALAVMGVWPW